LSAAGACVRFSLTIVIVCPIDSRFVRFRRARVARSTQPFDIRRWLHPGRHRFGSDARQFEALTDQPRTTAGVCLARAAGEVLTVRRRISITGRSPSTWSIISTTRFACDKALHTSSEAMELARHLPHRSVVQTRRRNGREGPTSIAAPYSARRALARFRQFSTTRMRAGPSRNNAPLQRGAAHSRRPIRRKVIRAIYRLRRPASYTVERCPSKRPDPASLRQIPRKVPLGLGSASSDMTCTTLAGRIDPSHHVIPFLLTRTLRRQRRRERREARAAPKGHDLAGRRHRIEDRGLLVSSNAANRHKPVK